MFNPKKPIGGDCCGKCKYSFDMNDGTGAHVCRRFPPTPIPMAQQNPMTKEIQHQTISTFPPVHPDFCLCGEYAPKIALAH